MRCSIHLADKLLNPEIFAYLTTPKYGVIGANVVLSGRSLRSVITDVLMFVSPLGEK